MADFGKLNFSVSFNPTSAFPIDARYYFNSYEAAQVAASSAVEVGSASGTYFYGENLVVVEDSTATLYIIQPDKSLKEVGSAPVGDNKTITVGSDGVISILGAAAAETGSYPTKKADGTLEWIKPDTTTVEGLTQEVEALESRMDDVEEVTGQIDSKIASAVASAGHLKRVKVESLPSTGEANEETIYMVPKDEGSSPNAYDEYMLIEGVFEKIGDTTVDLSGYATTTYVDGEISNLEEQVTNSLNNKVDKKGTDRLITEAEASKLSGIANGAQVNIIEGISIDGEEITPVEKIVEIPKATALRAGLIKPSTEFTIGGDGTLGIASVNVSKLTQTDGDILVLDGGASDKGE